MPSKAYLSDADVDLLLDAARDAAAESGVPMSIAIVDDGGHLLRFARLDGAILVSIESATNKALTANKLRAATIHLAPSIAQSASLLAISDMSPFAGGLPIAVGGMHVGAIGVSGGSVEEDEKVAQAALAAFAKAA